MCVPVTAPRPQLCQGKDKAATRAALEYSLSAAVGLKVGISRPCHPSAFTQRYGSQSAFLNSVLVGLALLKPETVVHGKTKAGT